MNNSLAYSRKDDIKEVKHQNWGSEMENLLGVWCNTNSNTGHIAKVKISYENDHYYMHAYGAGVKENELIDWGKTKCDVFSSDINTKVVAGLLAECDFGFMETKMAALIKYGVLVIQTYNTFKDDSDRSNYFLREFFNQ